MEVRILCCEWGPEAQRWTVMCPRSQRSRSGGWCFASWFPGSFQQQLPAGWGAAGAWRVDATRPLTCPVSPSSLLPFGCVQGAVQERDTGHSGERDFSRWDSTFWVRIWRLGFLRIFSETGVLVSWLERQRISRCWTWLGEPGRGMLKDACAGELTSFKQSQDARQTQVNSRFTL